MTISITASRKDYVGNGVLDIYPFDFTVLASSDLRVYVAGILQTLGVHYTVTGTLPGVGNVVFVAASIPPLDAAIIIEGDTPLTQQTDLNAGQQFYEADLEQMVDKVTILLQQIKNRSALLPAGSPVGGPVSLGSRVALGYLRWNLTGTALEAMPMDGVPSTDAGAVAGIFNDIITKGPWIDARAYGCVGNGVADDTTAIVNTIAAAVAAGTRAYFPSGTYLTSAPIVVGDEVEIEGEIGTRLKLTAAGACVLRTIGSPPYLRGVRLRNLILDGGGYAADGLKVDHVINGHYENIRATNVTGAGFHLDYAQLCTFVNPMCSGNHEAFTTTPVNGLKVDTSLSSANTFINPTFEGVSGAGIFGDGLINSVFINGTSENNDIGVELGVTPIVSLYTQGNTFIGMDLEANSGGDLILRTSSRHNEFVGLKAGYLSPAVTMEGVRDTRFIGGTTGGFDLDADCENNQINGVRLLGDGATITDLGTNTLIIDVAHYSTTVKQPQKVPLGKDGTGMAKIRWGTAASVGDGETIAHGLGENPYTVIAVGSVTGEIVTVASSNATTFTVNIKKYDADGNIIPGTDNYIMWMVMV